MKNIRKYLSRAQMVVVTLSAVLSAIAGALGALSPVEAAAMGGALTAITPPEV